MPAPARRPLLASAGIPLLLIAVHATNDAFSAMLAALLPTLQARFDLSEAMLAVFVATLSFSSAVTQPLFGGVADRVGRRAMAAIGIVTSTALLSLVAVAPSPVVLFLLLLVGGLGSAAFHPAGTSLMRIMGERFKELAVAVFSSGGTLGMAFGPVVILLIARTVGLRFSPLLMIPGLVLGALLLVALPKVHGVKQARRISFLDPKLVMSPVGALSLAGILRSLAFVSFNNAMPLWLAQARGFAPDAPVISWTLAAFALSGGLGGIMAGALSTRMPRRPLIVGAMLVALPAMLSVLAVTPGSLVYYLLVIVSGASANAAVPLLIVSAQDMAPGSMGAATGMLMGFTWGTAGVLYLGEGLLQQALGLTPAMVIAFLGLVPAAVLASVVLARHREVVVA
ncbi:MAG TPA: MFS transporter [Trueperaceae bacterium]|nr:MFS transporter [Trueperaceae bacterium]